MCGWVVEWFVNFGSSAVYFGVVGWLDGYLIYSSYNLYRCVILNSLNRVSFLVAFRKIAKSDY